MRWEWLLAVAAPGLVAGGLLGLGQVTIVLLVYQVGWCLVVPALLSGRRWRDDVALSTSGWQIGLVLALVCGLAPILAAHIAPDLFPDRMRLRTVLAGWGVDPERPGLLLGLLALVNGPAEEIFWRGWLLTRIGGTPRARAMLAVLFTSYHAITIGALAPSPAMAAVMLSVVLAAAMFWTWSRQRWHSITPALLSHTGATLGYVAVAATRLS